jgi:hypothetical protein
MGSFNAEMAMESERRKYTGPIFLPKNAFQIFYVRVKVKANSA